MANVLTEADEKAMREAQKRYREEAEEAFKKFKERLQDFLQTGREINSLPTEYFLKEIRNLFGYSDAGPARFLEISKELNLLSQKVKERTPELPKDRGLRDETWWVQYLQKAVDECTKELQVGSEVFFKLTAKPELVK
jgi:hypothetical protein